MDQIMSMMNDIIHSSQRQQNGTTAPSEYLHVNIYIYTFPITIDGGRFSVLREVRYVPMR